MSPFRRLLIALFFAFAVPALGQLAPTGEHYGGRPSDTGYAGGLASQTGTYSATIPLDFPAARGGLPIPLAIAYRAHGVGAAGLGWDVPLSFIQVERSFAHRRPLSAPGTLPVPPQRGYISLLGQSVELQRQGSSDEWRATYGTLALRVRQAGDHWEVDDGSGRLYTFTRPAVFGATGLWLLSSISAAGGARVELAYQAALQALDGGEGIEVSLTGIRYNPHPTSANCWKHEIALAYDFTAPRPLSLSVFGNKILVRRHLLTRVDVRSRATCATLLERLRRYELDYPDTGNDPDTGLPRLRTARMFGRQGTAEESVALPVAAYDYGTATQAGALRYQPTQTIALPPDATHDEIGSTLFDTSISVPQTGQAYAMWQDLIDVNGDGRPDFVFQKNDKLWVGYSQPGAAGLTTIGAAPVVAQLSDATLSSGPLAKHTSTQPRFHYLPAKSNVEYVWRQAIDINGDGRIDIIDASEQADHWIVYLNTPGPLGTVKWQRRSFSVAALRATLNNFGHIVPNDYVPLAKRATGTNLKVWECWKWSSGDWQWYGEGFANHACEGVDGGVDGSSVERGNERSFVEWALKDINGDGYPDFVFNSTPVTYQLHPRPTCPNTAHDNAVCPGASGQRTLVPFAPLQPGSLAGRHNTLRAMLNVVGVRFYTDDRPFAQAFELNAQSPEQGIEQWACSGTLSNNGTDCPDESLQSQVAGLDDVNGDGLVDRVVGNRAYLGVFAGTAATFSGVRIGLPGPLAVQRSTHSTACAPGSTFEATAETIQALRDLTGDSVPDYVDAANHHVWIGTGAGFFKQVDIATTGADFRLSLETELCDGKASITSDGLFDIDGDGRPEIVSRSGSSWRVAQLTTGAAAGAPAAGRLVQVDNGYGAVTHIGYVSAKTRTDNPVPFPEIVVGSVEVVGTLQLGGSIAGARYAYSNAELVFDSAQDRFVFPGYRRSVELRLYPAPRSPPLTGDQRLIGAATVTDTWPQTEFHTWLLPSERWLRVQRVGRVSDVLTVRGSGTMDPWTLLDIDANDARVVGVAHQDWDAKLFQSPLPDQDPGLPNCIEIVDPLDFQASIAAVDGNAVDICRARGFAFATLTQSWYGASPPPSTNNVQTRTRVVAVDDFGRVVSARHDNDVFRGDDDVCVERTYATPGAVFPRVLSALAQHRLVDCDRGTVYASESFAYDNQPAGSVADGRVTAHVVDRHDTTSGAPIGSVRVFDATYDSAGNVSSVRSERDGATRTVSFGYDAFGLAPLQSTIEATGIAPMARSVQLDPVSLAPLDTVDQNQVHKGRAYDGFGRWIQSTLALPGGTSGVVASVKRSGFDGPDPLGRRVTLTQYLDPVPPAALSGAVGRSVTTYLDELGRSRRSEVALGADYAGDSLVIGMRSFDIGGRIAFAARPYPKSEEASAHYGITYYYKTTGELDCLVRGSGPQAFTLVTDPLQERYPECFERSFADHLVTTDVRDASSLQASSPQAGVVQRLVASAIGDSLERSTLKAGTRLEYSAFTHDRLGQLTSMSRFLTPATGTDPVQWSWKLDSIGHVLQLVEPEAAPRSFDYSDWGELTGIYWLDSGVERRIDRRYDALGRLVAAEERSNGVPDPDTVRAYAYDTPSNATLHLAPSFVQGRLSEAVSPAGRIAFSYDALGRVNGQAFLDDYGVAYVETFEYHPAGGLATLGFRLPDAHYADETVKYGYDSVGRLRGITTADASGEHPIYKAESVDPLGRVRKATFGAATTLAADYLDQGRQQIKAVEMHSPLASRRIAFATFDARGREMAREEFADNTASMPPTYFTYDALGSLAAVQSMGALASSWQFRHDALGNLTHLRDVIGGRDASISYRTGDRDRICRIEYSESLTGSACNVDYDASGGIVGQPTRDGSRQLAYFASGQVRSLAQGDASARFAYDAFGGLSSLDVQSATSSDRRRDRHFGSLLERRDVDSGGATTSQLVRRIPGGAGLVATHRGSGGDWVYAFGETRGLRYFTDDAGHFVQDVGYQPFGEAQSTGAQVGTVAYSSEQWNGGDTLASFGLVNLGARVYDPVIGRFLSRDALLSAGGAMASNPYAFARNDPINASDPSGLCVSQVCGIQAGSGGGDSSGGPSVGPLVDNLGSTLEHLGSLIFGSGPQLTAIPWVTSGPRTVEGLTRAWVVQSIMGDYAPEDFKYDAAARTGEPFGSTLDRVLSMGSIKLDQEIDAYNAKIDRWKDTARIVGGSIAAGALLVAGGWAIAGAGALGAGGVGAAGVLGSEAAGAGGAVVGGAAGGGAAAGGVAAGGAGGGIAMAVPGAVPAAGAVVVGVEEFEPQIDEVRSYLAWWWYEGFTESGRLATIENNFDEIGLSEQAIQNVMPNAYNNSLIQLMTRPLGPGTYPGLIEGVPRAMMTDWGVIGYEYNAVLEHIILRVIQNRPGP